MAEKFKAEQVIEALRRARGVKAAAARALGCDRNTVDRYIREYATVAAAYEEANETNIDLAEGHLMKAIDAGNIKAILFYLRTKGKARGYVERTENRNTNIDLDACTDDELRRIASGEDPIAVLAARRTK